MIIEAHVPKHLEWMEQNATNDSHIERAIVAGKSLCLSQISMLQSNL